MIYMNDLQNICEHGNYLLYADDTVIYNTKEVTRNCKRILKDLKE